MANLCDDMLEEIVSRSSAKTILRFKAVSKRWLSNILVLPRLKTAPTMSGFFYSITRQPASILPVEIDYKSVMFPPDRITLPSLYLPLDCIRILDTCNGLVLYMQRFWEIYYVCNPITQALVMLPKPPLARDFVVQGLIFAIKLVFDPRVSHEFKVIRFSFSRIILGIHLEIFSSETEKWVELMIPCDSDTLEWFPYFEQSIIFVHEALYLSILPVTLLKIDVEGWYSWLVKFPSDSFFSEQPCLGKVGEDFYLACLDRTCGLHIQVFVLVDDICDPAIWYQMYRIDAEAVYLQPSIPTRIHLKAFHLDADVIYLVMENKVYAYHLENKWLEDLKIELQGGDIDVYPFSPCALNVPRLTVYRG